MTRKSTRLNKRGGLPLTNQSCKLNKESKLNVIVLVRALLLTYYLPWVKNCHIDIDMDIYFMQQRTRVLPYM